MKHRIFFSSLLVVLFLLHTYGLSLADDYYRGHREYPYHTYDESPEDEYGNYPGEQQERPFTQDSSGDAGGVLGVLILLGFVWLSRRLGGGSSSSRGHSRGSGSDNYSLRYSSPKEEPSTYSSHSDPSTGPFWGNPQDGTNVKSLWGTTKDE